LDEAYSYEKFIDDHIDVPEISAAHVTVSNQVCDSIKNWFNKQINQYLKQYSM